MNNGNKKYFLVGDISATNSTLAVIEVFDNKFEIKFQKGFLTNDYSSFDEFINNFLFKIKSELAVNVVDAVFAVAGKIEDGRVNMTNVDHTISTESLIANTQLEKVELVNDFFAVANSVNILEEDDLENINDKSKKLGMPVLVVGPGTGLGVSVILFEDGESIILDSEGAHIDFSVLFKEELELVNFIKKDKKLKMVRMEDIVSGRGLESIYSFLCSKYKRDKDLNLTASEISKDKKTNKVAGETFDLFYKFLARAIKNLGLMTLPEGGIYIAGGIVPKNMDFDRKEFMKEFTLNEVHSDFLRNIPIYIVKPYDVSIKGLGNYCVKKFK